MDDMHVLMQHDVTGGTALFPPSAVELWHAKGWHVVADDAASATEPASQSGGTSQSSANPKTKAAARGAENQE